MAVDVLHVRDDVVGACVCGRVAYEDRHRLCPVTCDLKQNHTFWMYRKYPTNLDSKKWAASWQNQQCGCAPSEDSDQPGHSPRLIRVFAACMKKLWVPSYPLSAQRRLWSDWADAQADLSLRWAHTHFIGFVMLWLKYAVIILKIY